MLKPDVCKSLQGFCLHISSLDGKTVQSHSLAGGGHAGLLLVQSRFRLHHRLWKVRRLVLSPSKLSCSYNPIDTNCVRDTKIITLANALTAVYACGVVFSILGFKAQHLFEKCMAQ